MDETRLNTLASAAVIGHAQRQPLRLRLLPRLARHPDCWLLSQARHKKYKRDN